LANFSATRNFALRERGFEEISSSVAAIGFLVSIFKILSLPLSLKKFLTTLSSKE
jgi:hypothetical protein